MAAQILEKERVGSILAAFFSVYNYYGYGLSEAVYVGALAYELETRGHEVVRELRVPVDYQGRHVTWQRLDMVVDNRVVVETKATEKLSPAALPQLISYLRVTQFEVGLLLHFGPRPVFHRVVDSPKRHAALEAASLLDACRRLPADPNSR
jgi:GxxExxY protein